MGCCKGEGNCPQQQNPESISALKITPFPENTEKGKKLQGESEAGRLIHTASHVTKRNLS
jgi:hypothetical protein